MKTSSAMRIIAVIVVWSAVCPLYAQTPSNLAPATAPAAATNPAAAVESEKPKDKSDERFKLIDVPGLSFGIDVKTAEDGGAGVDYELEWVLNEEKKKDEKKTIEDILERKPKLKFLSEGFIWKSREENPGSLKSEFRLDWAFIGYDWQRSPLSRSRVLTTADQLNALAAVAKKQTGSAKDATEDQIERLQDWGGEGETRSEYREKNFPEYRFALVDAHIKSEAEQSYENDQLVAGFGLATDMSIFTGDRVISKIIDFPFRLTRTEAFDNYVPELIRMYLALDYVNVSANESRAALTDDDEYARAQFELAWGTRILTNVGLTFKWHAYYEFDAPNVVRDADKDFTSFVEVKVAVPVSQSDHTEVFIKYVDGDLPPFEGNTSNLGVGFSIGF